MLRWIATRCTSSSWKRAKTQKMEQRRQHLRWTPIRWNIFGFEDDDWWRLSSQVVIKDSKPLEVPKFSARGKFQWVHLSWNKPKKDISGNLFRLPNHEHFNQKRNLILTKGVWCAAFLNHSWEALSWRKVQLSSHPTHHHPHNNRIIVNIIIIITRSTGCLLNRVVGATGGKRRRTQQGCYFGYHESSGWMVMTMMVILVMIMAMMVMVVIMAMMVSIHTKSRGELSKAATSDIMNLQVGWSLWCWCIWLWRWWSL